MASARSLVLLPPSETKARGGKRPAWSPDAGGFPQLAADRQRLADLLSEPGALSRLTSVAAARTLEAIGGGTLPALRRYTGVLYDALDVPTLVGPQLSSAGSRVGIISGLAGFVLGRDPVPDYSLPIGTVIPTVGGLGSWWKPRLTPVIDNWVAGAVVWDLLPGAHAAAWNPGASWRPGGRCGCSARARSVPEQWSATPTRQRRGPLPVTCC